MRAIVDLPEEQVEALKHLSEQSKLSRAELMRRAIAEYLCQHRAAAEEGAFGIWRQRNQDALDYERSLRKEREERTHFSTRISSSTFSMVWKPPARKSEATYSR